MMKSCCLQSFEQLIGLMQIRLGETDLTLLVMELKIKIINFFKRYLLYIMVLYSSYRRCRVRLDLGLICLISITFHELRRYTTKVSTCCI